MFHQPAKVTVSPAEFLPCNIPDIASQRKEDEDKEFHMPRYTSGTSRKTSHLNRLSYLAELAYLDNLSYLADLIYILRFAYLFSRDRLCTKIGLFMTFLPKRAKTFIFLGVFSKIRPMALYYDPTPILWISLGSVDPPAYSTPLLQLSTEE